MGQYDSVRGRVPRVSKLIVIGGGVRSGKSRFALELARGYGKRCAFIATARPGDAEMARRIERHRGERGSEFETVEEHVDVPAALEGVADRDAVVIDCLTLWLSNLLEGDLDQREILACVDRLVAVASTASCATIVVSNEVGMGIVPTSSLGRAFRDLAGLAHQRLSAGADEIYLATMGTVLKVRPSPLEVRR